MNIKNEKERRVKQEDLRQKNKERMAELTLVLIEIVSEKSPIAEGRNETKMATEDFEGITRKALMSENGPNISMHEINGVTSTSTWRREGHVEWDQVKKRKT